jgi:hypothetical protein
LASRAAGVEVSVLLSLAEIACGVVDLALAPPGRFIKTPLPAPSNKPAVIPMTANFLVFGFVSFVSMIVLFL